MLNMPNLEAAATARRPRTTVWLSPEEAFGVLPDVLGAEDLDWETIAPS